MNYRYISTALVFTLVLGLIASTPAEALPAAGTYIVNSDTDAPDNTPGDGVCATLGGNCTLRAAIEEANLDGINSVINFCFSISGYARNPWLFAACTDRR